MEVCITKLMKQAARRIVERIHEIKNIRWFQKNQHELAGI